MAGIQDHVQNIAQRSRPPFLEPGVEFGGGAADLGAGDAAAAQLLQNGAHPPGRGPLHVHFGNGGLEGAFTAHSAFQPRRVGAVAAIHDPEVNARPQRRTFTAEYKRRILAETDAAAKPGDIAALLRREALYSSRLTAWRRERDRAAGQAFARRRGPRPERNPMAAENEKLRRQNQHLERELHKAELVIEVQKKVARLLDGHDSITEDKDR